MRHFGLELRLLGPDDASKLAALEAKVFADAWDAGHFAGLLGQDYGCLEQHITNNVHNIIVLGPFVELPRLSTSLAEKIIKYFQ